MPSDHFGGTNSLSTANSTAQTPLSAPPLPCPSCPLNSSPHSPHPSSIPPLEEPSLAPSSAAAPAPEYSNTIEIPRADECNDSLPADVAREIKMNISGCLAMKEPVKLLSILEELLRFKTFSEEVIIKSGLGELIGGLHKKVISMSEDGRKAVKSKTKEVKELIKSNLLPLESPLMPPSAPSSRPCQTLPATSFAPLDIRKESAATSTPTNNSTTAPTGMQTITGHQLLNNNIVETSAPSRSPSPSPSPSLSPSPSPSPSPSSSQFPFPSPATSLSRPSLHISSPSMLISKANGNYHANDKDEDKGHMHTLDSRSPSHSPHPPAHALAHTTDTSSLPPVATSIFTSLILERADPEKFGHPAIGPPSYQLLHPQTNLMRNIRAEQQRNKRKDHKKKKKEADQKRKLPR